MKNKLYKFDSELYPIMIYVGVTKDRGKLMSEFTERDDGSKVILAKEAEDSSAVTIFDVLDKDNYHSIVMLFDPEYIEYSILTHECKHAADKIFDHICEQDTRHESHAYLVGWLMKCCLKALNIPNKVQQN